LYLHLQDLPAGVVRQVRFLLTAASLSHIATEAAAAAAAVVPADSVVRGLCTGTLAGDKGWGYERMLTLDSISSWQQVDQALKQRQLVHAAGSGEGGRQVVLRTDVFQIL
jgi:hypothetical protein